MQTTAIDNPDVCQFVCRAEALCRTAEWIDVVFAWGGNSSYPRSTALNGALSSDAAIAKSLWPL